MEVILAVALDSAPPLRRAAYQTVVQHETVETAKVATALGLPTNTARRILEDLAATGWLSASRRARGKPIFGSARNELPGNERRT
jgi:predicted ArsR family transcriptional regulator